ncbi:MAG: hypothetical protein Q7U54_18850 [Bacteroidales bacterium]|nr:hypothetical protein [Bacteroidales bacterium]
MGAFDQGLSMFINMALSQVAKWIDSGTPPKKAIDEMFDTNFYHPTENKSDKDKAKNK